MNATPDLEPRFIVMIFRIYVWIEVLGHYYRSTEQTAERFLNLMGIC